MSDMSRRPIDGSTKLVNYTPVTSLLTRNSMTLSYDGNGLLETVEISDGHMTKTMVISRNGSDQITGVATTITEV